MRLRRTNNEAESAPRPAGPGGTAAAATGRRSSGQPAPEDIHSIGVAIMPGMPLPDWVTASAVGQPASMETGAPAEAMPEPAPLFEELSSAAVPASAAFPQIDPAYAWMYEQPRAAESEEPAEPEKPAATPPGHAVVPTAVPTAAWAAEPLPAPDPAQWAEQPAGPVTWGPLPEPAPARAAAGFVPAQGEALPAAAPPEPEPMPVSSLAPPSGPAYAFVDDEWAPAAPAGDSWTEPSADWIDEPAVADLPVAELPAESGLQEDAASDQPTPAAASPGWGLVGAQAPAEPEDEPPAEPILPGDTRAWFVTDEPQDAAPPPLRGAGQYGWLFQPDEPAPGPATPGPATPVDQAAVQQPAADAARFWFDPDPPAAPQVPPAPAVAPPGSLESRGATAATIPVQWSGQQSDATPGAWFVSDPTPVRQAVAAQSPYAEVAVPAMAPMAAPALGTQPLTPAAPPPAEALAGPPAPAPAVPARAPLAPMPFGSTPTPSAQPSPTADFPAPVAAPRQHMADPGAQGPAAPGAPAEPARTPPPSAGPARTSVKRLVVIGALALALAALAAVALFVTPGFLRTDAASPSQPTIATPATAAGLIRTARPEPQAVRPLRQTAAAIGAAASSSYATYASGEGTAATVWDSNGSTASPDATMQAYQGVGGDTAGRLVSVPAGPRGGTMACAAASATRTVCFWNGDGVVGGADVRGLGRTEAGALVGRMRIALEQPAA